MNNTQPFKVRCATHGIHEIDIQLFFSGIECMICHSEANRTDIVDLAEPIDTIVEPTHKKRKTYTYKVEYQLTDMGHWLTDLEFICTDYNSFAYTIEFPDLGYEYIGIKKFNTSSEWRTYNSSSSLVHELVLAGHRCIRTITQLFTVWSDAKSYESNQLTINNVPLNPRFLNIVVDWDAPSKSHALICDNHYYKLRTYRS